MSAPLRVGRAAVRLQQGFSLLEALVAMAIASIAFAALYSTVGQSSKVVVDVDARAEAALVARSVLASATFAEDLRKQPSGQSGAWRWAVQVSPDQVPVSQIDGAPAGPPSPAARVVIEVSSASGNTPVLSWVTWKPLQAVP